MASLSAFSSLLQYSPSHTHTHTHSPLHRLLSLRPSTLTPSTSLRTFHLPLLRAQTFDFSSSFFQNVFDGPIDQEDTSDGLSLEDEEDKPQIPCPPGLRRYESMAVLRPDMTEDQRLALTLKYEELLVAGGGMYVAVQYRGVLPLSYSIKKKNKAGETNTYLDGIQILFTYFTKPESMADLDAALKTDDDIIRSSTVKVKKMKVKKKKKKKEEEVN